MRQGQRAGEGQRGEHEHDRAAAAVEDGVQRAEQRQAGFDPAGGRVQPMQHRRQEAERAEERDQHAGAGDEAKLGDADERGGGEGEEPGGAGQRRDQDLRPGAAPGLQQGGLALVVIGAGLAVADGELDAEIDRDAGEQHRERDRDQVQRAHRERGEAGGHEQAEQQREDDRHDQAPGADRQEQQDRHQDQAGEQALDGAVGHGGEFLVLEGDVAGQADMRPSRVHEFEAGGRGAEGLARGLAGLEGGVVKHRPDLDEPVLPRHVGQLAGEQPLPRQRLRMPGHHAAERGVEAAQRGRERAEVGLAGVDALGDQRQGVQQPAQAWVGGELAEEGLGVDGLVEQRLQLRQVKEQQGVALEVGRGVGAAHAAEMGGVGSERGGELGRGDVGLLGGRAVDDGDQHVLPAREGAFHRHRPLPPGQGGREQGRGVGGHAEPVRGEPKRAGRERERREQDEHVVPAAQADPAAEDYGHRAL